MPEQALNKSQIMTIGAKELAILVVPKGCIANKRTRMAQDTPTIVAEEILGLATVIP
jgi:hypothetical protein